MTLTLILVRHAKSDCGDGGMPDHDRPLNPRGERSSRRIGRWLKSHGHAPDIALVSTARRAAQTWARMAPELGAEVRSVPLTDLYHATPEAILVALGGSRARRVMVVAHNPGLAALAQWLVETTPERVEFHRFPTCATLVLEIDREEWSGLGERCARVVEFVVPRDLGG